jgi:hypothetical protein
MKLVFATRTLADTGGEQTYALTVAEQLARLGHDVMIYALELGMVSDLARQRALRVVAKAEELPAEVDGVIVGANRGLALELAGRYPQATRVFVVHSAEDTHLPPPVPGTVAATVVLNDLHAARAKACVGVGEVVRLRQPVDMRRFSPRGWPRERPERVLLLGNYHSGPRERAGVLREAWGGAGLQWHEAGGTAQTLDVPTAIAEADVVVGYGRSVLEAMACGRVAYVHDQAGSEGWITPETYARMEAGGFAVVAVRLPPSSEQLSADIEVYRAEWGLAGRDIVRLYHDARDHAAALVTLIERLGPGEVVAEPDAMRALAQLAESQLRAELMAEHYRVESGQWFTLYHGAQEKLAQARGEWEGQRAQLVQERDELQAEHSNLKARHDLLEAERDSFEQERVRLEGAVADADERLAAFKRTRRYRLAQALVGPLDRLRGRRS